MPKLFLAILLALPFASQAQTSSSFSVRLVIFTQCQALSQSKASPRPLVACSPKDPHARLELPPQVDKGVPIARTVITY